MKNKKLSLTIGIPAHNEENGISKLITSIFSQNQKNFTLGKVIEVCDGCTDNTPVVVKQLLRKHRRLVLKNDGKRKGKAQRINELFKMNTNDVLVCIDADVTLGKNSLNYLVKNFENPGVSLVGGCDLPYSAKTFSEGVSVAWIKHWQSLVRPLNNYDNPTNCPGRLYAMRNTFLKSFSLPTKVVADDHFVFYMSKKKKKEFKFEPKAIAYFQAPVTLKDFIVQSVRFGKSGDDVKRYFGKLLKKNYSQASTSTKIRIYTSSLIGDPIHFSVALLLQLYIRWKYNSASKTYSNGQWESIKK